MRAPSPALMVSLVALAVALGGTGYAVTQLPRNSVGRSGPCVPRLTPKHSSQKKAEVPEKPKRFVFPAMCAWSAWNMPWSKMNALVSGAVFPSASVVV